MSDEQFKKGDVVQLKSGSPRMTVFGNGGYGMLECRWWNPSTQNFEFAKMNPHELEKCPDSVSGKDE